MSDQKAIAPRLKELRGAGIGSLEGNSWGSVGCRYWVPKVGDAAEEEGDGLEAGKDDQARNINPSSIRWAPLSAGWLAVAVCSSGLPLGSIATGRGDPVK